MGVDPHLHGRFIGLLPQFLHQVPHLHFRAVDHVPSGGVVDRIGHQRQDPPALGLHAQHVLCLIHGL
jgi:hypothetical protein